MNDDVPNRLRAVAADEAVDLEAHIAAGMQPAAIDDPLLEDRVRLAQVVEERIHCRLPGRNTIGSAQGG